MDTSIGERIRNRRKELNLTQTQIQQATGISSGNMSGIESNKSLPSASALIELSKVLNCSIDWMLTGNSLTSEDTIISNIEEFLLAGFRELPDDDKDELIEMLKVKLHKVQKARGVSAKLSLSTETNSSDMVG